MKDPMEDMETVNINSFKESLELLMDPENIEMKTEIKNPLALTKFQVLIKACKKAGFIESAKLYESYVKHLLINMVSDKRKRVREYLEALIGVSERFNPQEMSLGKRLTSNLINKE